MRFFSIITALLVGAALYLMVFERQRIMGFANGFGGGDAETEELVSDETTTDGATSEDAARVVHVVALKSIAEQIDNAVLLRGQTQAARQVDVRAETTGLIESEPLRKGSYVEAGQLLCRIAPGTRQTALAEAEARLPEAQARIPEAQGRLAEAQARLQEARINDNAARSLSADGFASETRVAGTNAAVQAALAGVETAKATLQSASAGVKSASAAIESAQKELDRLEIAAPFSGLLETDTAELGTLMQPGALCATVIQLNPIKMVAFVPETEVAKVKVGAQAGGRTTAGQDLLGQVTFLSRSADPETRTFRVEITVKNTDGALSDGQTAEILIATQGQTAHLIPASAMTLNNEGTLGVRVVDDAKAGFRPVSILRDTPEGIWISGLDDKAEIIVTGQEYVTDGVRIDVSYDGAEATK